MKNKPLWQECIEAFGGYESAKKAVEVVDTQGLKTFNVEAMRSHLLEYRREHGIYEVGDKVVSDDSGMIMIFGDGCEKWFCLRHATALEIQTGHRLP